MASNPRQNRLILQKSPYLLQHAHNPVDWYPWGEEAFEAAKAQDKPIFLSIGYATCHWCHVMSRESFDNPEVAKLMNEVFINIKVDREELPEIDSLYMEFAQALMASGSGWPLNVLLTPDLKPFYAVTYLPPESHQDMMGLKKLTTHIQEIWNSDERELLFDQAEKLVDLFARSVLTRGDELPGETDIDEALETLFEAADPVYGGMKGAPKFPLGYHTHFFLGYAKQFDDSRPLYFVETTLNWMHRGGIYDQVGGGFSRYSVDEKWATPHFEKMLYDNAILARAYLDTWKYTKKPSYKRVTQEILSYVLRDMKHPEGGFYSAEDADTEEKEGTYYLWSKKEIYDLLPQEDAALFCEYFDVTDEGNFEGKNILHCTYPIEEFVGFKGLDPLKTQNSIDQSLSILAKARESRKRPFKDDKILVSWNALMIDALLNAGLSLKEESYVQAAVQGAEFIRKHLWKDGKLLRRFREGQTDFDGCLDDYAFLVRALLTLFEGNCGSHWLKWAIEITTLLEEAFKAEEGAFYLTSLNHLILLRRCELYDGAQPSGNAIHTENLLRLYQITHNREYLIQAEDILKVAKTYIETYPQGACYHLIALGRYLDKDALSVIVALDEQETYRQEISELLFSEFSPNLSVIWKHPNDEDLLSLLPYLKEYPVKDGQTTVYVCKQGACLEPACSWESIQELLKQ